MVRAVLSSDGIIREPLSPAEESEMWRVLRAYFPGLIETHSTVPDFYFGGDLMLRRHDYNLKIAGGFGVCS